MSRPGDELTELLWDNGPALRTTTPASPLHFPPFQPFTCSAAGSSRAHELDKRHGVSVVGAIMDDDDVGLPVHHRHVEEDDAVPWLHCPGIDDGDSDTAPLPPEYCESLLSSGYSALHAVPEPAEPAAAPCAARPLSSNGCGAAVVVDVPATQPQLSGAVSAGESIMNFSFFSRPLQRPAQASTASPSNLLESTVGQQTAASRLRNTPLFSEQRMAWLQPPSKAPRAPAAAVAAPAPHASPAATDPCRPHQHAEAAAAAVTTSSVCSANGDRSQSHAKRSSEQHAAECSVSQDEDVDDEPGAARRSAGRGTKRSRTAEVHNLSERRRRDRINEKMRALQELIPNCNKVDKASMLEEAIEYLKTLQLQVQMMSMGAGLCVPPPPAAMLMQMQMPVAAAYPYLGMGLGFGMGAAAFDMRFAGAPQFPGMPPAMAMPVPVPHGPAMFGMPPGGQAIMPPFAHVMNGGGAAPAEQQRENAAVPAPGGAAAGADARPPVPVAPQGDQKQQT